MFIKINYQIFKDSYLLIIKLIIFLTIFIILKLHLILLHFINHLNTIIKGII